MSQELREMLKSPFVIGCCYYADDAKRVKIEMLLETEQRVFPVKHYPIIKNFIEQALNEKYERDFHTEEPLDKLHPHIHCPQCQYPIYKSDFDTDEDGEPLRWIKTRSLGIDWIDCPKCKHGLQEGTKDLNFCPFCGRRLLPPEGE